MRKLVLSAVLAVLVACGGDATGPNASLYGNYTLRTVDGNNVPAVVYQDTLEKDELTAGSTAAVDYTFTASGPFAFACHEPAHYEAGMKGTIDLSGG